MCSVYLTKQWFWWGPGVNYCQRAVTPTQWGNDLPRLHHWGKVWWGMMRYSEVCESLQLWLRFYNSYLKRMLSVVRELSMTKFPWDLELLTLRVWCGMQYIYYIYMSLWSATWDSGPESGQEMVKLVDLMIMFMNTTIYWWMNTTIYLGCWTANNYYMSILC